MDKNDYDWHAFPRSHAAFEKRFPKRVVMVGEQPAPTARVIDKPLTGKLMVRMLRLSGVACPSYQHREQRADAWQASLANYLRTYILVNLFYRYTDDWPRDLARCNAQQVERHFRATPARRFLLLGRKVAAAFGVESAPWFEWIAHDEGHSELCVMPHPSSRNRWWNLYDNRREAQLFLTDLRLDVKEQHEEIRRA